MRFNSLAQLSDLAHILASGVELPITAFFVKRKIQEEHLRDVEPEDLAGGACFGLSYQALELAQVVTVLVERSLLFKFICQLIQPILALGIRWTIDPQLIEKTYRHSGFVVRHAKVAGSQVSKGYLMPVTAQSVKRPRHSQFGIQWFRSEDQDPFLGRIRWNRPVRVVCIRLPTWPTSDSVLKFVEDANVKAVGRAGLEKERGQTMFSVVFVSQP